MNIPFPSEGIKRLKVGQSFVTTHRQEVVQSMFARTGGKMTQRRAYLVIPDGPDGEPVTVRVTIATVTESPAPLKPHGRTGRKAARCACGAATLATAKRLGHVCPQSAEIVETL